MRSVPKSLRRCAIEVEGWLEFGCPERALARVDRLLEHPGGRVEGLRFRAAARIGVGEYRGALEDLTKLRSFEHDVETVELQSAWCHKRLREVDSAIACMRRLIEHDRRSAIGHYNLACYLALQGQSDEALERLAHACGLEPDYRDQLAGESDFDLVRDDPLFQALIPRPRPDPR